jgi:hypothetical protein
MKDKTEWIIALYITLVLLTAALLQVLTVKSGDDISQLGPSASWFIPPATLLVALAFVIIHYAIKLSKRVIIALKRKKKERLRGEV